MLKRGAIWSLGTLVIGTVLIVGLVYAGVLPVAAVGKMAEALVYFCLAIFGVFWTIHAARKSQSH